MCVLAGKGLELVEIVRDRLVDVWGVHDVTARLDQRADLNTQVQQIVVSGVRGRGRIDCAAMAGQNMRGIEHCHLFEQVTRPKRHVEVNGVADILDAFRQGRCDHRKVIPSQTYQRGLVPLIFVLYR